MSGLNYKQVTNVTRRTWDVEAYEKRAQTRQQHQQGPQFASAGPGAASALPIVRKRRGGDDDDAAGFVSNKVVESEEKEEFMPAEPGAVGPEGSQRAFLKARKSKVDIDSKIGTTELIAPEAAAITSTKIGIDAGISKAAASNKDAAVVQTGVGWHCRICDCFLKDSHTYLDHINGRKHQRKLGYSMRVQRSTKDEVLQRLSQVTKNKEQQESEKPNVLNQLASTDYHAILKAKDEDQQRRRDEKRKKREEKKRLAEPIQDCAGQRSEESEENDFEVEGLDLGAAAMMGFSGFGGSSRNG